MSPTIHTQPKIPLAGLGPAIYVFRALVISAAKTWMPGTSPGKGYLQLRRSRRSILHCPNWSTGQPWSRSSRPDLDRCSGFTLIEVIVTLAILGLALVLVAGYKPPWSSGLGLKGAASELASGLRLARSEAITSNRPVPFDLDVTGHVYRVGAGAERRLPSNLTIELLTITGENRGARVGDIRFNPDGSSTGGRITLADGTRRVAVGVDWLTGRVSVADLR